HGFAGTPALAGRVRRAARDYHCLLAVTRHRGKTLTVCSTVALPARAGSKMDWALRSCSMVVALAAAFMARSTNAGSFFDGRDTHQISTNYAHFENELE